MFAGVSAHFRALAHGRVLPLGRELLAEIDASLGEILDCGLATHAAIAAVVGLRRTLFPDAQPYRPITVPALAATPSNEAPADKP
jgi:hypothetical protein